MRSEVVDEFAGDILNSLPFLKRYVSFILFHVFTMHINANHQMLYFCQFWEFSYWWKKKPRKSVTFFFFKLKMLRSQNCMCWTVTNQPTNQPFPKYYVGVAKQLLLVFVVMARQDVFDYCSQYLLTNYLKATVCVCDVGYISEDPLQEYLHTGCVHM